MGTTLTGTQINNTYDALIKVTDNGPIGATPKLLTDGLGNDSKVALGTLGTTFTGAVDFTGASVTGLPAGPQGAQGAQGPAGPQGAQGAPGVPGVTYDLLSAQSGANAEILLVGSDSTTDIVTLVAGTNITLTDTGNNITIDAAGGGGAATPAMSIRELPQFAMNSFGAAGVDYTASRTWVSTTGFATGTVSTNALNDTSVGFAIFSMQPGEVLEGIEYIVSTAGAAGAVVNIGIYELDYRTWAGGLSDQPSGVVLGDKIKDFGGFAATTTGQKTINVSASPFTMPTTSKYGAIALAFSTNDNTVRIASLSNAIWDTYTSVNSAGTAYRMLQPYASGVTTGGVLPANLAGQTVLYKSETSNPVWAFIQTKN